VLALVSSATVTDGGLVNNGSFKEEGVYRDVYRLKTIKTSTVSMRLAVNTGSW